MKAAMHIRKPGIATVLGFTWGIIPMSYLIPGGHLVIHLVNIGMCLTHIFLRKPVTANLNSVIMLCVGAIFFTISMLGDSFGNFSAMNYVSLVAFSLNLFGVMNVINGQNYLDFSKSLFETSALTAIAYILMVESGMMGNHYGRFYFFGDSHPNLGGEIYAIASFAGALAIRKSTFVLFCVPMIAATLYLQSRTGTVIIFSTIVLKIFFETNASVTKKSLLLGSIALVVGLAIAILPSDWAFRLVGQVLLTEDSHRGASTGYVSGRDTQWAQAWQFFLEKPITGWGMGLYSDDVRGAHNPVLYSLSMFGVFGVLFWVLPVTSAFKLAKNNLREFLLITPVSLMLVLNDRFMDNNTFPLLYYFYLIQLPYFGLARAGRISPKGKDLRGIRLPRIRFSV
ncbi:O-antigen ligase family protein [Marinibacterium profundimaris]|uniref:O-antigen ligase-related domain-containing protein n=1 Tax=Marinibacterium profundimaris TaxID=1679460 RepID=A0A225NWG4_9RHOB|nr:O-antigen ligase family protein [Marinibacterium profundimaris]OWU77588.1 hypothetical protein ATO3_02555 [Marinibacterium profundimaris]